MRVDITELFPGRQICPACQSPEKSFSVYAADGRLRGTCFRASCGAWGINYAGHAASVPTEPRLTPYQGSYEPLGEEISASLLSRYGFLPSAFQKASNAVLLPVWSPTKKERGVMEMGWDPKYRKLHKALDEPMICWYHGDSQFPTFLFEDQISAQKFRWATGRQAVALLGTNLTQNSVAEIQKMTHSVVLALDADATQKAFDLARTWGSAFTHMRVSILTKDVKDMERREIEQLR